MDRCKDEVEADFEARGATLTPEEKMMAEQWCDGGPAFMVIQILKFNRCVHELRALFKAAGCAGDEEFWILAFAFLSLLMDPKAAFDQAKTELDQARKQKSSLDAATVKEKILKARNASMGPSLDGSEPGDGPK